MGPLQTPLGFWRRVLEVIALVAMIAAAGVLTYVAIEDRAERKAQTQGRPTLVLPTEPVSLAGAPTKGLHTARVVLIVFSDFQCPFCARFAKDTLPEDSSGHS